MSRSRHERSRTRTPGSTTAGKKPSASRRWYLRYLRTHDVEPVRDARHVALPSLDVDHPAPVPRRELHAERASARLTGWDAWDDYDYWRDYCDSDDTDMAYYDWRADREEDAHYYRDEGGSWWSDDARDASWVGSWLAGVAEAPHERDSLSERDYELELEQSAEEQWIWDLVEDRTTTPLLSEPDLAAERARERLRAGDRHYRHARR